MVHLSEDEKDRLKQIEREIAEADAERIALEAAEVQDKAAVPAAREKLRALCAARSRLIGEEPDPQDIL